MSDQPPATLTAALEYAARGWHVFPCRPASKTPATEHGFHDATTDPDQLHRWWSHNPDLNLAIATGPSQLVIVDVDEDADGHHTLDTLEAEHGPLPATLTSLTADGQHRCYRAPADVEVRNTAGRLGPGIDTRGAGGYIVAPPSIHPTGVRYEWLDPDVDVADLPGWIVDQVARPRGHDQVPRTIAPLPSTRGGTTAYARAALDREAAAVGAAPEGTRNDTLNRAAYNLGQLIAGGQLDEPDVIATLTHAAQTCGLPAREISQTIRSGLTDGRQHPRHPQPATTTTTTSTARPAATANGDHAVEPPPPDEPPDDAQDEPPSTPVVHHRTDLGNARRLVDQAGHQFRWVPQWGTWLHWDGRRWARDTTREIDRRAKRVADTILTETAQLTDHEERKKHVAWALRTEGEARIRAMVTLTQTEPGIPIEPHQLDADPWLLNVENGTLDLRTGELHPHDPALLITKLAPVHWDADATYPDWDRFLDTSTGGDTDLAGFLARLVGYTLTGDTREEILALVHGPTQSGKSTFAGAVQQLLGDYARRADFETFLARNDSGSNARPDIARLAGARYVVSYEVDEGKRLAEGLVKTLTGGDTITARFLYRDDFEFVPAFKLWLVANHAPKVRAGDDAIWRRILRIPFTHTVPADQRDDTLKPRLEHDPDARAAILAWAVRGCEDWQAHGLGIPDTVRRSTDAYRADQDPLRDWITDRIVLEADTWTPGKTLRDDYTAWCEENGIDRPVSAAAFADMLTEHGATNQDPNGRPYLRRIDGKRTRVWVGIRLRSETDPEDGTLNFSETPARDRASDPEMRAGHGQSQDFQGSPHARAGVGEVSENPARARVPRAPHDDTPDTLTTTTPGDLVACARCGTRTAPAPGALERGWQTICATCIDNAETF